MKRKKLTMPLLIVLSLLIVLIISLRSPEDGSAIRTEFMRNALNMIKILPLTFILIGLFEVWVKKERIEKHLGEKGGFASFIWVLLLGGTTIGPMIVALPIAASLYKKGARLSVVFTYIGAAAVCRVPMTIFESSYLGVKFTLIRYAVSIPLIIISSVIMCRILNKTGYQIREV